MQAGRGRRGRAAAAGACAAALVLAAPAAAQEPPPQRPESMNLRGMTGLIDMPTARVQPDGRLTGTISNFGGFTYGTLTFQALPRLEGAFRYAILNDFFLQEGTLYDRSFDVKLLLARETRYTPALAIGLQDFLGTGVLGGEYVVASKEVAPGLTLSGGVGWGRFAGMNGVPNPIAQVFPSFSDRDVTGGNQGDVRFGQFFRGEDMGIFGGVEWRPRWLPDLTLKAEYSSDDYSPERRNGPFDPQIPLNFGAEYRVTQGITIGAYAMYGSEFGLRATFQADPLRPAAPQSTEAGPLPIRPRAPVPLGPAPELGEVVEAIRPGPAPGSEAAVAVLGLAAVSEGARWAEARAAGPGCPVDAALDVDAELGVVDGVTFRDADGAPICTVVLRPEGRAYVAARRLPGPERDASWHEDPERRAAAEARVRASLEADRIRFEGLRLEPRRALLEISNPTYAAAAQAVGRAATALANELPASVEDLEIVVVEESLPAVSVHLRRAMLEAQAVEPDQLRDSWLSTRVEDAPVERELPAPFFDGTYPRFGWFLTPALPLSFFDPDSPLRASLFLRGGVELELARGLFVAGSVSKELLGNLSDITRQSDSKLPRVRSDFARYLAEGDPGIERLAADYLFKLRPDTYGRVSAGLLERMFGGVSAEVLWKPVERSWGLGAELNWVRQRDYDMMFEFLDYDVVTGHASVYWDTGWNDYEVQVDAGRYLAGDWGATFSLSRRFANGWEVGGFFTLTDVPFDEFGEGSFDKGLRLSVPLRWGLPYETRTTFDSTIRPLTRDGGARLAVSRRLFPIVRDLDRADLREDWGHFWR